MDMKGWDVVYASSVARLNEVLAASSQQLLPTFSYTDGATGVSFSGTFGPWAIRPGGSANRINVQVPIAHGVLTAPGLSELALDGVEPVLNVALKLITAGASAQDLAFDIRDVASAPSAAGDGDVFLATADESGLLTRRDPSGEAASILQDALPKCFVANAAKISFVFGSVFTSPLDEPWLKPVATGVSYFESADRSIQAVAIKTLTQSPWGAAGLDTAVDPGLLGPGQSLFFALSQAVVLRNLLLPSLPGALGNGVTLADFQFNGPAAPSQQNACSITNTRSFGTRSVENAGISYYPQIDKLTITVAGSQIVTTASGHFDITGLSGAWVSFDNLQVVNEVYYDPASRSVKFHLVSQTKPSIDKHIPWEYYLLAVGALIGLIVLAVINIVVVAIDNAVQSALTGTGSLSVAAIPLDTAVWTGLKQFDISEADLDQALLIRGSDS
jgi:hypothetical protein